jgi:multiple sugar transport system substrate-binding protein
VGVPLWSWVQGIWVNTAMLEERGLALPRTWEDVSATAKVFHDPTAKKYGISLPTSESAFTEQVFSQFALSNGANVFDGGKSVTINTPEMREAVAYYKELASYSMPGSTEVADVRDAFVAKNAPMALYSTYILGAVKEAGFAEDLALVLPEKKEAVAYGCITVLAVAEGLSEAETQASKDFVKFLLEKDHNITLLNMAPGGIQPVLKVVSGDPAFTELEARQAYAGLNDDITIAVENLQLFGAVEGKNFTEMGDITNTGIISKMINNVVIQNANIDAELEAAQTAVEDFMK